MTTQKHVIIAGFGRSGQSLAKLLERENIPYYALDLDPDRVHEAQVAGASVSYGDSTRKESLVAAGIHRAAALVVTYANTPSALKLLHFTHELAPNLPVIVRSYDDNDLDRLKAAGATEVVPETMEASLMLASHAMVMLGIPLRRVVHSVQQAREERYASLRGFFHGSSDTSDADDAMHVRLHSILLAEHANAIGKSLAELNLASVDAEVTMIRRSKMRLEVTPETVLQNGDVVVVRGPAAAVALAEEILLR